MVFSSSAFACGASQMKTRQLDSLQAIVTKHIKDPALAELASSDDFSQTSLERGVQRWEQAHMVAALDVLLAYQRDRRAKAFYGPFAPSMSRSYQNDPRTRMVELLKRFLRSRAACSSLSEDEVRGVCSLCRDLLDHRDLFPAKNKRSFLCAIAEVYDHLQWQLQEVLEKDKSCANLAQLLISLSKNFVSDALAYLLLAPTDLSQTDALPSLEVVSLWQSLPDEGHPLPDRKDANLQKRMGDAWQTRCGSIVAALLRTPWCVKMFRGADEGYSASTVHTGAGLPALEDGEESCDAGWLVLSQISEARNEFASGNYKGSSLVGALRGSSVEKERMREDYIEALVATFDLTYLLGEVMLHFHRISEGLGDYGMIKVSSWLHPILEALVEKVQRLKYHLESLNKALDSVYVLGRARGRSVEKPAPSSTMSARAHCAYQRAVSGDGSHAQELAKVIEQLKSRSAPKRLPAVAKELGDACLSLRSVLASAEFRACVGDKFPDLPAIGGSPQQLNEQTEAMVLDAQTISTRSTEDHLPTLIQYNGRSQIASSKALAITDAKEQPQPLSNLKLRAEVYRLMTARMISCGGAGCGGPSAGRSSRHDRRLLAVSDGKLHIYEKSSKSAVKTAVDLPASVDRCLRLSATILDLAVFRLPEGAAENAGVWEHKEYIFEFDSPKEAKEFFEAFQSFGVNCLS
eukprot:TRINITY_DN2994_c0_g1_i1.p1 TRINITY_DN2994_c0_g1~~TRINITY_DN2994_c0_g1_i1.p1  ORF type:complete len:690 (-),score=123.19 TRINITY_DN2994_c0_g1_i1:305-2374(-)